MTVALVVLAAVLAVALPLAGYYRGLALDRLTEIAYLKKELEQATDRLLAAHKDSYYIPDRGVETPFHVEPLSEETRMWLEQWEDRGYRAQLEAEIRMMVETGKDEDTAVLEIERGIEA